MAPGFIASIFERGLLHGKDNVNIGHEMHKVLYDRNVLERRIGKLHGVSSASLHVNLRAKLDQLWDYGWHQSDATFVRLGLLQDGDVYIHSDLQKRRGE